MINRVFCYSKTEALKNGNKLPIIHLVLSTIIFIVLIFVLIAILGDNFFGVFILLMIIFMVVLIYYSAVLGIRLRTKMSGFAIDSNGKLYKAMTTNNGEGLYFAGYSAGSLLDQILSKGDSNLGGSLGGAIGAIAQFSAMNKSAEIMSHPEIIAKMIEQAKTITGGEVFAIENIHSCSENKNSIKIICDYRILRTDKIKYNKKIAIEKSYNYFDELKNHIYNYRRNN